jgi:excisionase family DNA binding protein
MNDDARVVSITEAAELLSVSVRTVQRRLDSGDLEAVTEGDRRRVKLPCGTTANTTGDTTQQHDSGVGDATLPSGLNESSVSTAQDGTPPGDSLNAPHSSFDAPKQATPGDSDATRELIEQLKGERDRLVEQLERAQDDAAQWRAMAAQLMNHRALPQSTSDEAVEGDLSASNVTMEEVSGAGKNRQEAPENPQREASQPFERTKGLRAFLLKILRG